MVTVVTLGTKEIEEMRLLADTGMVLVRWRDGVPWLGVSRTASVDAEPEVEIALTDRQVKTLIAELSVP